VFLNREKIAAGLSLLILTFGIYGMASSRVSSSYREISKEIPSMPIEVTRLNPRLYVEDRGADRNPFQVASDWAAASPEPLEPPETEPVLWISLPLGRGPDPAIAGFSYLKERPVEKKDDEPDEPPAGEVEGGDKTGGAASGSSTPSSVPPATPDRPAGTPGATGAAPTRSPSVKSGSDHRSTRGTAR